MIDDPEDKKPDGWDEIPKEIADPEATVPDDWDEADDGAWEPPNVPNPEYKGEWNVKRIENPDYKGDATIAQYPDFGVLAFEVWQVKSGTIFDSIMITDDEAEAKAFSTATYSSMVEAEKKAKDEADEAKKTAEKEAEKEDTDDEEDKDDEDDEEEEEKDELWSAPVLSV